MNLEEYNEEKFILGEIGQSIMKWKDGDNAYKVQLPIDGYFPKTGKNLQYFFDTFLPSTSNECLDELLNGDNFLLYEKPIRYSDDNYLLNERVQHLRDRWPKLLHKKNF